MDLPVVASSFALLFLAELGDKTQLMTIALARRYRALPVALGACAAFLVLNALAVFAGRLLGDSLPRAAVLAVAGVLFLAFAWQAWRSASAAEEEDGDAVAGSGRTALLASFSLIFVAELGDKTQLALIALAAGSGSPWSAFLGATLALWSVALLGIALGATLLARVPRVYVHRGAAVLFAIFGAIALSQALGLPASLG